MFASITRSWNITRQSWNVLRQDKHLMLFPVLSSMACLLVLASFAFPFLMTVDLKAMDDGGAVRTSPLGWVVVFAFYFVNFFVITFFNSALIACALARFNGEDSSASAGLRAATARLPQIFAWSALAATVGVALQMLIERLGVFGKIVIRLIGMAWAIATFFVVPVLVVEGTGPVEAVKRSVAVLKKNWGESLVTNVGIGAVSFFATLAAFVPFAIGVGIGIATESAVPFVVGGAVTVLGVIAVALVTATLKSVVRAALYRYATTGMIPEGFDAQTLKGAFRQKGRGDAGAA